MSAHLTDDDRFLRGELSGEEAAAVLRHLAECRPCAEAARASDSAARAAASFADELLDDHPDVETTLTAYVDGTLEPREALAVDEHLERCRRCREDVADLRSMAVRPRPRRVIPWLALAAAALIGIVTALLFGLRKPASPRPTERPPIAAHPAPATTPDVTSPPQREVVLEMPATLAALLRQPDVLRGAGAPAAKLEPYRAIVESTRPRFAWPATEGASATYVVSVLDGEKLVMQSDVLAAAAWTPPRDLARGRTYQWEVDVRTGGDTRTLPAPPAPPALFRVLDAAAHEELERTRAARPNDPLLLGALYARNGLRDEALRELRRGNTDEARRLLRRIEGWPR
jgi:anti-sigma factor RsiW